MSALRVSEWRKFPVTLAELCIDTTLRCGQSFRWIKRVDDEWTCALHGQIISLKQDSSHLHYRSSTREHQGPFGAKQSVVQAIPEAIDAESLIKQYLNLATDLSSLYAHWSLVDPNFKTRAPNFKGVRILKQDPWEALLSFICSSNNNISRISQMINNLCLHYGSLIGYVDGKAFHEFPPPEALVGPGVESHLRELGFGYRAGYISKTALLVAKKKPDWLQSLCNPEPATEALGVSIPQAGREGYRRAHEELLQLPGVGPKVADCVCLMGLGWGEAVPVDTHVWQIAQRDYKFGRGKHRSLTKATYDAVGDHFRELWGQEAGWAHSVLFAADLPVFSDRGIVKIELDIGEDVLGFPESKASVKRVQCTGETQSDDEGLSTPKSVVHGQRAKRRKRQ